MARALPQVEILPMTIRLHPVISLTDDQLFEFCAINGDLRIERTAQGELLIMPPTWSETGYQNSHITAALTVWARQDGTGVTFDSSTGFILPNWAMRSPDAAWISRSRLAELTREQKRKFIPLCPDFVVELRSPSDRLSTVQAKMQEYLDNGAHLGWLIDPGQRYVYIYSPPGQVQVLENAATVSGDPRLPVFVLELQPIWKPDF